jgi:hypothetical protein
MGLVCCSLKTEMFLRGHVVADKTTEGCLTIGDNDTLVTSGQILTNKIGIRRSASYGAGVPLIVLFKRKRKEENKIFASYE